MHPPSKAILMARLDKFLAHNPLPENLWVFAYGSLLWNPEMDIIESRRALLPGYKRGFNLLSTVHRGTPEDPGLVLSLRNGGHCEGLVFRVNRETRDADFTNLWLREMVSLFYQPKWCDVETAKGTIKAITFVADMESEQFVDFDDDTTAQMIHHAHGERGPNIDYFTNTHNQLESLGIEDPLFTSLAQHIDNLEENTL
jgi:cation transport protein ChaC